MVHNFAKQYRRYLQDCLGTYETLKSKTCPTEYENYEFMNQRDNPIFHAEVLFPIFKDCKVKFVEFSYEDQDSVITNYELYWTIAFSKWDTLEVKEWFKKNTNLDFSIDNTHSNYDLMRILAKDICDMLYSNEVEELKTYLDESSKQCEDGGDIFEYTEPSHYPSYDGDWTYNESLNTTQWIKDDTHLKYKVNEM